MWIFSDTVDRLIVEYDTDVIDESLSHQEYRAAESDKAIKYLNEHNQDLLAPKEDEDDNNGFFVHDEQFGWDRFSENEN